VWLQYVTKLENYHRTFTPNIKTDPFYVKLNVRHSDNMPQKYHSNQKADSATMFRY